MKVAPAKVVVRDPSADAEPMTASSQANPDGPMARLRRVVNRGGDKAQWALEENPVSRAVGRQLVRYGAPPVDRFGGVAARKVVELGAAVDSAGATLVTRGSEGGAAGPPMVAAGFALRQSAGKEALRQSSVLASAGIRLNIPVVNFNAGVWASQYFPSAKLVEQKGSYTKAMYTNYGADVESPVASIGWARRGRAGVCVNLYLVAASYNDKQESVFIGVPGIFGVSLGSDVERGAYLTLVGSAPITPLLFAGPLFTSTVNLYSPLLEPVNQRLTRPLARIICRVEHAVVSRLSSAVAGTRAMLNRPS